MSRHHGPDLADITGGAHLAPSSWDWTHGVRELESKAGQRGLFLNNKGLHLGIGRNKLGQENQFRSRKCQLAKCHLRSAS